MLAGKSVTRAVMKSDALRPLCLLAMLALAAAACPGNYVPDGCSDCR